jgi:phage baseplate assembly protein V
MISSIRRTVEPLRRRIHLMIGRAVLSALADGAARQRVQFSALKGEVKADVERVQDYGFTSHPLPGAQIVFVSLSGNRDHPLVIRADDPRHRKKNLEPGEVCLYTDEGDFIHLKRGRIVEIVTDTLIVRAATKITFDTPLVEGSGAIRDGESGGMSLHQMRAIYDSHVHPENDGGGPTDPPVQEMGA